MSALGAKLFSPTVSHAQAAAVTVAPLAMG